MEHRVELPNFAGPLDLLLFLVQRQEVDIRDISLVRICDQYFEYLKRMKEHDIELAGEFFVMAATLMSIKARSLLPEEEIDLEKELDPEEELLQQLLEYRRIKEAARNLSWRADARELIHPSRPWVSDAGIPLEEVGMFDLIEAFRKVLQETGLDRHSGHIAGEKPLSDYINDLLSRLRSSPRMSFFSVFAGSRTRIDLIGYFLSVLELIKVKIVRATQPRAFGEIAIEAIGEVPEHLTWEIEPLTSQAPAGEGRASSSAETPSEDLPADDLEMLEEEERIGDADTGDPRGTEDL